MGTSSWQSLLAAFKATLASFLHKLIRDSIILHCNMTVLLVFLLLVSSLPVMS